MTSLPGLSEKTAGFDRDAAKTERIAADQERQQIAVEFPLAGWPHLPLERYALGLGLPEMAYCRLLEFGTPSLGSISGGSAAKHIMFRHNTGVWRMAGPLRGLDPHEAWERLRAQFVSAFTHVAQHQIERLDELDLLTWGPALTTKSLAAYFPQEFLPIYSLDHLRYFITLFGHEPPAGQTWTLNRVLRSLIAECPELSGWSGDEVMTLLYTAYDPRAWQRTTILKVAPGENARWWPDCHEGHFIAVGWDDLGDLTEYESDADLQAALDERYPDNTGVHLAQARALLVYRDLTRGDLVVANQGKSRVLAVGTVTDGYRYSLTRDDGRHLVDVQWDTSYAQTLSAPQGWQATIVKVRPTLWAAIQAGRDDHHGPAAASPGPNSVVLPDDVSRVIAGLDRKKQVILFGVPGTGKTRLAFRTALALTGHAGELDDPAHAITDVLNATSGPGHVRMVTFHPNYGYEDFVEGLRPRTQPGGPDSRAPVSGLILDLVPGVFTHLCRDANTHPDETFVLIIDELNRGDLPRILGELVTVLETDKRGMPVLLTSGSVFTVPANVLIIATMNVADRSIGHLDAAIRRRFACINVAPDPDAAAGLVGPLDLSAFLEALNRRIVRFLGPDQQLGHSFLLADDKPVAAEADLHAAFYDEIVPLLEDYAVGRTDLMKDLLGTLYNTAGGTISQIAPPDLPGQLAAEFHTATTPGETAE